ncbi:MAG: hypothetical protein ABFE01_11245 [Phycisphaerales bacterium]
MRALLVNLRLLQQYRALWFFYVIVAVPLAVGLCLRFYMVDAGVFKMAPFASASADAPLAGMILICLIGLIVSAVQMETLSKSFAFCLPGYRAVLQNLLFVAGFVAVLVVSLVWPSPDIPSDLFRLRFFCTGLAAYFLGVRIGLIPKVAMAAVGFGPALLFGSLLPLPDVSRYFALPSLIPAIALSVATTAIMWLWLGRTSLSRRYCGRPWLGFSGVFNPVQRDRYRQAVASSKRNCVAAVRMDGFLLRTMESCEQGSIAKHLWSTLYVWLSPGGGGRSAVIFAALSGLFSAVMVWYSPLVGYTYLVLGCLNMEWNAPNSPLPGSLLLAGGRRERFLSRILEWIGRAGALVLFIVLGFVATNYLGPYMPGAWWRIDPIERTGLSSGLGFAMLLTGMIPIGGFFADALPGRRILLFVTQYMPAFLVILVLIFGNGHWIAAVSLGHVIPLLLLAWFLFAFGIYRMMKRIDLVRR